MFQTKLFSFLDISKNENILKWKKTTVNATNSALKKIYITVEQVADKLNGHIFVGQCSNICKELYRFGVSPLRNCPKFIILIHIDTSLLDVKYPYGR